jgi:hypothetical protein
MDQTSDKKYAYMVVLSVVALMGIWPSPKVLFFRHLFLGLGVIGSLPLIYHNASLKKLGLYVWIFCLLLWVGIHFTFFSLNPIIEWREITGLWLRVLVGFVLALGLVVSLKKYPMLKGLFFSSLFLASVIGIISYLYFSYTHHRMLMPNEFPSRSEFLFAKIETVFFGSIAVAVTCANLLRLMQEPKKQGLKIGFCVLGCTLALGAVILASAKNGILFMILLFGIFLLVQLLITLKAQQNGLIKLLFIALLTTIFVSAGYWHVKTTSPGWNTLLEDVALARQIEKYPAWKSTGTALPTNSTGAPVAGNTYERVAWITVGMDLIKKYPFGYGSINASFWNLLTMDGYQHNIRGQVHSGWVDLGLAFGLPALIIVWSTLLGTIFFGIKEKTEWPKLAAWIAFAIFMMGFTTEITYKEEFEAYMFLIAFASACFMPLKNTFQKDQAF